MLIGILQAGKVNEALAPKYGEYPPMFEDMFAAAAPEFRYRYHATVDGEVPPDPEACDAWLVTGSRHGVYDDLPWIAPTKAFLRAARAAGRPVLGICFGHQIVAEAFGGRAVKSDRGWGLGVQDYDVLHRPSWMADAPARIAFHAVHQDQVVALPDDATVLAASAHCPYALVAYGDPEAPDAVTIQPHPEFSEEFTRDLTGFLSGGRAPVEVATRALATIGRPVDSVGFAGWAARFLSAAGRRARAA